MTREDRLKAADILDDCPEVYSRIERLDGETMEEYRPFTEFIGALYDAVNVLRGPVPDPETGLVPCGCPDSKVQAHSLYRGDFWIACCDGCGIGLTTQQGKKKAVEMWNIAHGWRSK